MRREIRKTYNKLFGRLSKNKQIEIGEYEYVNQVGDVLKEMMKKFPLLYSYREQYIGDFASVFKLDEGMIDFAMEETEIYLHALALDEIAIKNGYNNGLPMELTKKDMVDYVQYLNEREFDIEYDYIIGEATGLTLNSEIIQELLNSEQEGEIREVNLYGSDIVHVDDYYQRLADRKEWK